MNVQCTPNIHYLLAAEFDNRYGPVVRNQYPSCIPGFEYHPGESRELFNLASLMLPNNAEYNTEGEADTTVFILYKNFETGEYQLFPPEQEEEVLFFVNVVYAQDDDANTRGTKIKAAALGTAMADFMAFKPFVQAILDWYMDLGEEDQDASPILKACFRLLNRAELTFIKRLHCNETIQSLFRAVGDESLLRLWLDEENPNCIDFRKLLKCHHRDKYTNRIVLRRGKASVSLNGYKPKKEFLDLARIPLEFDVVKYGPIDWALKYDSRLSKFLLNFIPVLRKRDPKEYAFKLVIFSATMMGEELSQFTISLSNLMGLGSQSNVPFFTLPYVDVSIIGPLAEYTKSQGEVFAIMGTTNPIFKSHTGLWDYYYDLDSEIVYETARHMEKDAPSRWDVLMLKKLLARNSVSPPMFPDTPSMGLLQKLIECIDEEETDELKVLSVFRKVNMLQLLQLNFQASEPDPRGLLNEYICKYRDFVVFAELFNPETLRILQQLDLMNSIMTKLHQPDISPPERMDMVCQLDSVLTEIHFFASLDEEHLERFMSVCFDYPFASLCSRYNLQEDGLAKVNIKQELKNCFKDDRSWMSSLEEISDEEPILPQFIKDRSLSLFCMPLLSDTGVKIGKTRFEPPDVMLRPPANASIRRRRSVNLKQMLSPINKNRDAISDGFSIRRFSENYSMSANRNNGRLPRSESSSTLSSKPGTIDVDLKTKDVKATAYKILCMIHRHFVGNLLIESSLSPFLRSMLGACKLEEQSLQEEDLEDLENLEI